MPNFDPRSQPLLIQQMSREHMQLSGQPCASKNERTLPHPPASPLNLPLFGRWCLFFLVCCPPPVVLPHPSHGMTPIGENPTRLRSKGLTKIIHTVSHLPYKFLEHRKCFPPFFSALVAVLSYLQVVNLVVALSSVGQSEFCISILNLFWFSYSKLNCI